MHVVALAWMYVVVMMALVEALSPDGTLLGALVTLLLYGLLPLSIVLYIMGAPQRRRARQRREAAAEATSALDPDSGSQAAGDTVAPVRKEG